MSSKERNDTVGRENAATGTRVFCDDSGAVASRKVCYKCTNKVE